MIVGFLLTIFGSCLFCYMLGYAYRDEADKMRISDLNKEIHDQLLTILSLEKKIETMEYLITERAKEKTI